MAELLEFESIQNAGLKECPVTYTSKSGAVFNFNVRYRPEGITPEVMITSDELGAAYKEQQEAQKAEREPTLKVDLAATSRMLASLIGWLGLTLKGELIPPSESFFLKSSFEFQAAILLAVMEDYNRPTSGSDTNLPATSSAEEVKEAAQPPIWLKEPAAEETVAMTSS